MLPIPPYAKNLYDLQKKGLVPKNSVRLWIGFNAWKKASAFVTSEPDRTMLLPPWEHATKYFWPVVGCDVLIHDSGPEDSDYIDDLILQLYKSGAEIVRYSGPDFKLRVYKKY